MNPSQVAEVVSKLKAKNMNLIQVIQEKDNLIIMLNKKIAELNNLIQEKKGDKETKELLNTLDNQNVKYTYTGNFIIYE
jgi:predicted transcriptional regulator